MESEFRTEFGSLLALGEGSMKSLKEYFLEVLYRDWVAAKRILIRGKQVSCYCNSTRVGMFDYHNCRTSVVGHGPEGSIGIQIIIEGHLLSVQLFRPGNSISI